MPNRFYFISCVHTVFDYSKAELNDVDRDFEINYYL